MSTSPGHDPAAFAAPLREQLEVFLDDHRDALHDCLDGITEAEARQRLVPSRTTLLGLVKHATFVEQVWFDEAITGRPRAEIGCPEDPDASFELRPEETVESVRDTYALVCAGSRARASALGADDVVTGNRRGRCLCDGCTCTCCASWPSTAGTPTSSGSRSSPVARLGSVRSSARAAPSATW